ncbi:hypothetical protein EMCRGX_G000820 [Ephydatia muelleri]
MSQIPPRTKTSTNFVEDIIAERMSKKRKEWLVRWKGFSHEDDTWEPLEHLSGCEQYIARSEEERDRKQAEDDDARGPVGDRKGRDAMMTKWAGKSNETNPGTSTYASFEANFIVGWAHCQKNQHPELSTRVQDFIAQCWRTGEESNVEASAVKSRLKVSAEAVQAKLASQYTDGLLLLSEVPVVSQIRAVYQTQQSMNRVESLEM